MLGAGKPVLAIPSNADQHLSTATLEDSGAGLGLRVEEATAQRLHATLERMLSDASLAVAAKAWGEVFQHDSGPEMFHQFLEETL
jgi:UDP:flavonoid glycosyltransferase YjiC (YdhE family)